jgi:hypothetical protein
MNDYFAALMRSSGAVVVGSHGDRADAADAPTQSPASDLEIEQHVEVESPVGQPVTRALRRPAGAFRSNPAADNDRYEVEMPGLPAAATPTSGELPAGNPAGRATRSQHAAEFGSTARAHRVVRAALEWVRADPGPSQSDPHVVREPDAARADTDIGTVGVRREARADSETRQIASEPSSDAKPRQESSRTDAARAAARIADVEETPDAGAWPERRRARAADREAVELSIGSIHIVVDPPAASATVAAAPVAPPQPPAPVSTSADARSFARRRLPSL